ncbi:MAG TPA: ribonuclease III domain-containing protein, partial [bacterium]|nr:ribonuclease III domain-containing protein [bacterium]
MQGLRDLEEKIEYVFKDKGLLEIAMTHSSYAYEKGIQSYERLEFLGDAVLNFIVAVEIFRSNPDKDEHFLTDLKSAYVNRDYLHHLGKTLELDKILRYSGPSDIRLDQAVEALIGAIYLDGGYRYSKRFIKEH